ncbi:MAG: hypothetical protein EOO25_05060 [Comamonadaceae bacterium]|nr:MAG: hypothetical protein EOO25_05060 [Comamonadaceae bacterium]
MGLVAGPLLALGGMAALAQESSGEIARGAAVVIDQAQVLILSDGQAPQDRAISLPLHWDIAMPSREGRVEVRMRFDAPAALAQQPWAVLIPRVGNAWRVEVNGNLLQEAGELDAFEDGWAAKKPAWVPIPAALLAPSNELKVTLRADKGRRAGLSRVLVGPSRELRARRAYEDWTRVVLPQAASVLSLLVSAFCLLLWWQQRDRLYAAAAVGELAWGLRLGDTWWEASPLPWLWWSVVVLLLFWVWTAASYVLVREVSGKGSRLETRAMALLIATCPLCIGLASWQESSLLVVAWMATSLLLWLCVIVRMGRNAWRQPSLPRWAIAIALALCWLALTRDVYAGRASTLLYEESAWAKFAAVTMALTVLLIVGLRFKRAREDLVTLNHSIQHRIEQRESELKAQYARLNLLEREKATTAERARILRDMHDGAGAHLIAAIHQIESGDASPAELLETLGESLDQLRLTVDAMNLPDGDIGGLLGSLRFRLERRIATAGLRLKWRADELPVLERFGSTQMRHVQFILIEAISNVIQHAKASELAIRASHSGGQIHLEVRDNGVGRGQRSGNGLRTMRERAELIGATLALEPASPGLRVLLALPVAEPPAVP